MVTLSKEIPKNSVEVLSYLLDICESQEQRVQLMRKAIGLLTNVITECNVKLDTSVTEIAIACAAD